jgi:hypothetical protein
LLAFLSKDVDKAQEVLDMRNEVTNARVKVNNLLKLQA